METFGSHKLKMRYNGFIFHFKKYINLYTPMSEFFLPTEFVLLNWGSMLLF